ncbi:dichlorophenolindophenol-dependent carveol dehydrogenase (plasmid) [Rhodococcus jostii RHA1]|uniref:Dichlorophenolindophenol-dependent carveol dehydrogenase n=1 Tax=Rhodococcus jostii (strain RHA1) TaxID=101510 RepID=Q0RVJ5_RHOJR|nr:mycofactocin-coupled SDR family oxidoreductase [Rhodococcus jostii]ABH00691.1 dichlorophenolindophenol-dependent carveol dehydrogenase [Rhodococcus jostii RHA1]
MLRLEGKVALVTGAARGQGRSHALRMAEEGANIIAVDLCDQISTVPYDMSDHNDLHETGRLVEEYGRRVITAVCDVRDSDSLRSTVARCVQDLGRLDIVCANAGIWSAGGVRDLTVDSWNDMISVNLTGVFNTAQATVEHLIAAGGGSFIATSSVFGLKGRGGIAHYASSKHGVTGLARDMAGELAPFSIRVNSIHPGGVRTPMVENEHLFRLFRPDLDHPGWDDVKETLSSMNALPIDSIPVQDISNLVLFLASDESRYITGTSIPVDAGFVHL